MKKINIACVALLFILTSCDKEIKYRGEQTEPLLVMNGVFESDSIIMVELTKSIFFLSNSENYAIKGGYVEMQINDGEIETLTQMPYSNKAFVTDKRLKPGDKCTFYGKAEGFEDVKGSITMPVSSNFELLNYYFRDDKYHFKIRIHDPIDHDVCYRLKVQALLSNKSETNYFLDNFFIATDKVFAKGNDFFDSYYYDFFDDTYFHGQSYDLEFSSVARYESYSPTDDITYDQWIQDTANLMKIEYFMINIQTITRDFFNYLYSSELYLESYDGLFTEPVQIFSNIENGIGILGGVTNNEQIVIGKYISIDDIYNRDYNLPANNKKRQ